MKMRKIVAILAAVLMLCSIVPFSAFAADTTVVFKMGADGSTVHADGNKYTTYTETVDGYTLTLNNLNNVYGPARDAKGNGCIKLGASSKAGGFSFTVPDEVTSVIIAVGKYKANTTKLNVNNTAYTLTKNSNDGAYDEIIVDTTTTKTITLTTVSGGYRAMVNTITYVIAATGSADCDHDSLVCGDTCPECEEFVKEHKYSNNCTAECENGCGTANPNYADHVYGGTYDAECDVCFAKREVNLPAADSELTISQAIELGVGIGANCYTEGKYYVTGEITEVYNTEYGNLYITDGENTFTVYGLYDGNGTRYDAMTNKPEAGMTIKVYGIIGNYNGTAQMKNGDLIEATGGCEHEYEYECSTTCSICGKGEREAACVTDAEFACVDGLCIYCGGDVTAAEHDFDDEWDADCNYGCGYTREVEDKPEITEATLDFSSTTQRTDYSTTVQVWENGGLKLTNNKGGSTSNVGNYSNPARFYKGSEIIIAYSGMTQLVINAPTGQYGTPWAATLDNAGLTYTVDGGVYTITFAVPVDSITLTTTAQVRANSMTATAEKKGDDSCAHNWIDATCTTPKTCSICEAIEGEALGHDWEIISQEEATCTAGGSIVYECAGCGEDKSETFPALPHTYVDGICSACGAELPSEATITFGADKAERTEYGTESQKWEHDGLVLINNKAESSNSIGDYTNPVRMYKGSEIIISFPGMTSLVIDGPGDADYAWAATLDAAGLTYTADGGVYTITFAEPTNSITLKAANQVRAKKITASAAKPACQHEYDNACDVDCNLCYEAREVQHSVQHVEAKAPTCTVNGNIEYWYCDVCGMAWLDAGCTLNTNLRAVVLPATGEHDYQLSEDSVWPTCDTAGSMIYTCACGDSYTQEVPAYHNGGMEYTPAKDAIDCANPGNIEYYFCPGCNEHFADANAQEIINPWYIEITVDCVKPEGLADCAGWTCETCGNENFGAGEHDVLTCQGGICSKCNAEIEGVGCANYDTPACQDGVCYYCGGFVAGFGHENGAWAPCCDGECSYGCGLTYPATEDHVDADADDYCDNCWSHLACVDADADGFCDVCWSEMPVADIVYGDANGDGSIDLLDVAVLQQLTAGWTVEGLNEAAADANGDGSIDLLDVAVLQQLTAGWDVTLGPVA